MNYYNRSYPIKKMTYTKWRPPDNQVGAISFLIYIKLILPNYNFHTAILCMLPRIITHSVQNALNFIEFFRCQIRCLEGSHVFFNLGHTACTNQC